MKKEQRDFVIHLNGGIGKAIMATSMIKWVSENYPNKKITVISPWPEIFEYNTRVWRNLPMHQSYIFEDYIKGKDYRLGEPYQCHEYYNEDERTHLMNLYPKAYGFGKYNDDPTPEVFLNAGELKDSEILKMQGPPIFTIQFTGGLLQGRQQKTPSEQVDTSQRDMTHPMGQMVANILLKKGFRVIQVAQQQEHGLQGVLRFNLPFRRFIAMCPSIAGHIGIDSSMMHACNVFKTPQLIFFGQTHPDNLGYKYDGCFNKIKPEGGYYRPRPGLPDNGGLYPYRHPNEKEAMNWEQDEVTTAVEEFLEWVIKNRIPKLYPQMQFKTGKENIPVKEKTNMEEVK